MRQQQAAVDDDDVQRAGHIQRQHEVAQWQQLLEPVGADQPGNQAEGTQRRHFQHEAGDLDHDLAELTDQLARLGDLLAQLDHGKAKQAGEEDHRQDRTTPGRQHGLTGGVDPGADARQRVEHVRRHHIHQHPRHRGHVARGVGAVHAQFQATGARLHHRAYRQPDTHRQRRGDDEPQEGAPAQRGHRFLAVQRADRVDHREEHQRHRDHLDQGDVDLAEGAEPGFSRRPEQPAGQCAEDEAAEDPLPEGDPQPGRDQLHARSRGNLTARHLSPSGAVERGVHGKSACHRRALRRSA
ncbi:hypothetical protein D3C71_1378010 [compost metagenome]